LNILGWTHWRILSVEESTHRYQITAEPEAVVLCCSHCGGSCLHRHEVKRQLFMDIPIRGKHTGILVLRKRYLCCSCKRTFFELLNDMNEHHAMTERLLLYLAQESLKHPFTSVADDVGVDERTVRRVFAESTKDTQAKPGTEQWRCSTLR
jgi:transposase